VIQYQIVTDRRIR